MYELAFISNIHFEPYLCAALMHAFSKTRKDLEVKVIQYENLIERKAELEGADMIVVCLNFSDWYPNAQIDLAQRRISRQEIKEAALVRCEILRRELNNVKVQILWFGFEDDEYPSAAVCGQSPVMEGLVDEINQALLWQLKDVTFLDFKKLIAQVGIGNAYSLKGRLRWNAPYSKQLAGLLADEIYKQYLIARGRTPKCLVLDCDNVLWGGVLADDGIEGIWLGSDGLGRQFQEFQRFVKFLWLHGVILAICSKNNQEDILRVFREHGGMLLKEGDVACFQCNWEPKAGNILAISERLNIGLADMVFVDDSVFEVEAVKAQLPEVRTVLYQKETIYDSLGCFHLRTSVDQHENLLRTKTYQSNEKRAILREQTGSFEEYLESLDMKLDIHETLDSEVARVAELTQRTNKCTNGTRYSKEEILGKKALTDYSFYTVCLSDRFSDLGIVGILGMCDKEIDLFSLSCRALGRKVEERLIEFAVNKKAKRIQFVKTPKNEWMHPLLEKWGVQITESA